MCQGCSCMEAQTDYCMEHWRWIWDCTGNPKTLDTSELWDCCHGRLQNKCGMSMLESANLTGVGNLNSYFTLDMEMQNLEFCPAWFCFPFGLVFSWYVSLPPFWYINVYSVPPYVGIFWSAFCFWFHWRLQLRAFPVSEETLDFWTLLKLLWTVGNFWKLYWMHFLHHEMVTSYCCKGIECSSLNENSPRWLIYLNASSVRRSSIVFNLD